MEHIIAFFESVDALVRDFAQANPALYPFLVFIGSFALFMLCAGIMHVIIVRRFMSWSEKTGSPVKSLLADLSKQISPLLYLILSLYLSAQITGLTGNLMRVIFVLFLIMCAYEFVRIVERIAFFVITRSMMKRWVQGEGENAQEKPVIEGWITVLLKTVLWTLAVLFVLNNLGIQITALAASLGITSIAVAFALQSILSDIFSSVSIYLDKPFRENDFIQVGTDLGVVQKIGIKTTRLTTLQGEALVIPNHELTNVRIRNYKQMEKRRIVFQVGVVYGTPVEQLRKISGYIRSIIEAQNMAEFDRAHFARFSSHELQFEAVYYVKSGDYTIYMDVQQAINLGIMEKFRDEKIEFAFPTQTIHIDKGAS